MIRLNLIARWRYSDQTRRPRGFSLCADRGELEIRKCSGPSLVKVEFAGDLNQVWTNLIGNAVDAMKGKGEITLKTYSEEAHVFVEITDNGPGIPDEIQPRVFEPFFTTKAPGHGTGLGLHISHDIVVNRHHGQLYLQSQPGKTTFRAALPMKSRFAENAAL